MLILKYVLPKSTLIWRYSGKDVAAVLELFKKEIDKRNALLN